MDLSVHYGEIPPGLWFLFSVPWSFPRGRGTLNKPTVEGGPSYLLLRFIGLYDGNQRKVVTHHELYYNIIQ